MLEVTEQRPMNNEYVNSWISKLSPVTLAGIFKDVRVHAPITCIKLGIPIYFIDHSEFDYSSMWKDPQQSK